MTTAADMKIAQDSAPSGGVGKSSDAVAAHDRNRDGLDHAGLVIRFTVGECWLGAVLVATTEKGICAILLGG